MLNSTVDSFQVKKGSDGGEPSPPLEGGGADLFRREALSKPERRMLGSAVLAPPIKFSIWAALSVIFVGLIVTLLAYGEYTRKARVSGMTVLDAGLIKIHAPQVGVVLEQHAKEGVRVKKGDLLFSISTERLTRASPSGMAGAQATVIQQLELRRMNLDGAIDAKKALFLREESGFKRRLESARQEILLLDAEISTQAMRLESAESVHDRLKELAQRQFVSELGVQQRRDEVLDQSLKLRALQRARATLVKEERSLSDAVAQLPISVKLEISELERELALISQDLALAHAGHQVIIVAPSDGTVTAVLATQGQVTSSQPLLTLLPDGAKLQAHLFVPQHAIGFVKSGQTVLVRYAAFPYQKFGHHVAKVIDVSRSPLTSGELPAQLSQLSTAGAYFRLSVELPSDRVLAYGKEEQLRPGMQLEADLIQDTRRIAEWLFEPVLGFKGRL